MNEAEERLVVISALVPAALASSSRALILCREHLPWLLDLVDKLVDDNHWLQTRSDQQIEQLQERVRELEHHFSDEANLEHMPTIGDLL